MTNRHEVDTIKVVLAGTPMGKQRVRFHYDGQHHRPYTPEKTVNYEGRIAHAAQTVMGGRPLFEGPVSVDLEIRMPIAKSKPFKYRIAALEGRVYPTKKPDIDNVSKILDGLNQIVWVDDSQIVELTVRKIYHAAPALIATIKPKHSGVFA